MRYMASIYVSDVMDQVALTVEVQGWSEQYGPPEVVYQKTLVWPGIGEDDPCQWAARALTEAASTMSAASSGSSAGGRPMGGPHTLSGRGDTRQDVMG